MTDALIADDLVDAFTDASAELAAIAAALRAGRRFSGPELSAAVSPALLRIGNALVAAHAADPRPVPSAAPRPARRARSPR